MVFIDKPILRHSHKSAKRVLPKGVRDSKNDPQRLRRTVIRENDVCGTQGRHKGVSSFCRSSDALVSFFPQIAFPSCGKKSVLFLNCWKREKCFSVMKVNSGELLTDRWFLCGGNKNFVVVSWWFGEMSSLISLELTHLKFAKFTNIEFGALITTHTHEMVFAGASSLLPESRKRIADRLHFIFPFC
jgi:hypothetical protein